MILHLWCSYIALRQRYCCFATVILRLCRSCGTFKFSDCARSALHQADNLAKLRCEILFVFELIAQILCAVSDCENKCGFLTIAQKFSFLFRGFPRFALNDKVGDWHCRNAVWAMARRLAARVPSSKWHIPWKSSLRISFYFGCGQSPPKIINY